MPGLARPDQVAGKTGLEVMRAMLAGSIPFPAMAQTLDFLLIEVDEGRAVFQGRPSLNHYNPLGSVHGGWFATLLDSAVACAVHTLLPAGKTYTTLELKVNYVKGSRSSRRAPCRAGCSDRSAAAPGRPRGRLRPRRAGSRVHA